MTTPRTLLLTSLLFTAAFGKAAANVHESIDPIAVEQSLLADLNDEQLDEHSLLKAALIAGGTQDAAQLEQFTAQFNKLATNLQRAIKHHRGTRERAAFVHAFLHKHILHGSYQSTATDVRDALRGEQYNCVTATVIYVELARKCGLKAHAIQLPEHVRCEVVADGMAFGVEPTSLTTWQAGRMPGSPRTLTDVELIATIFYNRGVAAFDSGDYSQAIELNVLALKFDPACSPARENLLAAFNNRVVELVTSQDLSTADEVLRRGEAIEPEYAPFRANRGYLERAMK